MSKAPWEFPLWGPMMSPLGAVYGAAMAYRRKRYETGQKAQHKFSIPVISVGNLTVGGVGKTPLVAKILSMLPCGVKACVLSRGYGAQVEVSGLNDEGHMLSQRFPDTLFLQGKDRVAAARGKVEDVDVIILDDGAQHLAIHRDLEILVFDGGDLDRPRFVLPAGPWRETLTAAQSANLLFLTRCDEVDEAALQRSEQVLRGRFPTIPVFLARHQTVGFKDADGSVLDLGELSGRRVLAVSGIGKPKSFLRSLESAGADVVGRLDFEDHASFGSIEGQRVTSIFRDLNAELIVTTEKDVAKIVPVVGSQERSHLRVLQIELDIGEGEQALAHAMDTLGLGMDST